jgi:ribonuclease P/MRP protein subunit RPP40
MVHGKKGFERLVWACKNVLVDSVTWLFLDPVTTEGCSKPLEKHHPQLTTCSPQVTRQTATTPAIELADGSSSLLGFMGESSLDLLEWIGLATLQSPRIETDDSIDPALSRYDIPLASQAEPSRLLVSIRYRGFLPSTWLRNLFIEIATASAVYPHLWFSMSTHAFETETHDPKNGYTILRPRGRKSSGEAFEALSDNVGLEGHAGFDGLGKFVMWEMVASLS